MSAFPQSRNERRKCSPPNAPGVGPPHQCATQSDEAAFETLFRTYYAELCAFARSYVRRPDIAEELVADVFVALWQQHASGRRCIDPRRYLYRAARNQALKHLAHERVVRRAHEIVQGEGRAPGMSTALAGAEDELEAEELASALEVALDSLPSRCREAFERYRCDGMTYPEIADIMHISVRTVETHVGHARKTLRHALADWLGADSQ